MSQLVFTLCECPNCSKGNAKGLKNCTNCGASLSDAKMIEIKGCSFCEIIEGKKPDEIVLYVDEKIIIFLPMFPLSHQQVVVVPLTHVDAITDVDNSEKWISMLDYMHSIGTITLKKLVNGDYNKMLMNKVSTERLKEITYKREDDISSLIHYGFNHPPQIPHLHLVIYTLPLIRPVFEDAFLAYPRWIPYFLVMESLNKYGHVKTGDDRLDLEKQQIYRKDMIETHNKLKK